MQPHKEMATDSPLEVVAENTELQDDVRRPEGNRPPSPPAGSRKSTDQRRSIGDHIRESLTRLSVDRHSAAERYSTERNRLSLDADVSDSNLGGHTLEAWRGPSLAA